MPKLLLYITFFFAQSLPAQQITLRGQVSIHNSKYETGSIQYVQDAYVSAPFAGSVDTDAEGIFSLPFVSIDAGTEVKVKVEKADLEVVNDYDLQRVIIGRKPLLRVYLMDAGKLANAQTELYNISKEALFARKDALISGLLGEKDESKVVLEELEKNLGIEIPDIASAIELLENKIIGLEKRLPEFAQELAAVNLDFASDLYVEAYEYYKQGEIEKAIKVLDDAKLDASYESAVATMKEGERLENIGQGLQDKGLLQIEQIIASYELKAESFILLFKYQDAVNVYKKIVRKMKEAKGEESLDVVDVNHILGSLYLYLGDYKNAFIYYQENVNLKETFLDPNDPGLAASYNSLAIILSDLGEYGKALIAQQKSLDIREQVLESNHPDLAVSYSNLSLIYKDLGAYEKALIAQQKSLDIREQILESNHPDLATSYNNLTLIYEAMGEYEKALIKQRKSLGILEQVLESDHPNIAILYQNLAGIYKAMGAYEEALIAQQKSLGIRERVLESDHPSLATSYKNLGSIYFHFNQLDSALYYKYKAYSIWKSKLSPGHPEIKKIQKNIAFLYDKKGRQKQSNGDFSAAIKDFQNALIYTQDSSSIYNLIGLSYYYLQDYLQAIKYYDLGYQMKDADQAIYLDNSGMAYTKFGDFVEAESRFKQLQLLIPENATVYRNWAIYYALKADIPTALSNLEKALDLGFNDLNKITQEEAFQILHQEPRYQAIIQKLKSQKE